MGLLTSLFIYSRGKKRGAERLEREAQLAADELLLICDNCGHPLYKHSDDGRELCPTYS